MKKLLAIGGFCILMLTVAAGSINASGLTTNQTTQPGQVLVHDEDGVVYLTTDTNGEATAAGRTRRGGIDLLGGSALRIPEGFAENIAEVINSVLRLVLVISALLVFLYLVWGAIDWITSGGDKGKTDRARQKMIAAIVGILIIASSFAVVQLIVRFLGFESFSDVFDNVRPLDAPPGQRGLIEVIEATPSAQPSPTN